MVIENLVERALTLTLMRQIFLLSWSLLLSISWTAILIRISIFVDYYVSISYIAFNHNIFYYLYYSLSIVFSLYYSVFFVCLFVFWVFLFVFLESFFWFCFVLFLFFVLMVNIVPSFFILRLIHLSICIRKHMIHCCHLYYWHDF